MNRMDSVIEKCTGLAKVGISLVLLFAAASLPALAQSPENPQIADVVIIGNHNVPTQRVLANIKTRKGRDYSLAGVQEDARRLAALGSFRDVRVRTRDTSDGRILVEFIVQEHVNLVHDVVVRNARHVRLDQLQLLSRIRKGTPLNPMLNKQVKIEIEDFYQSKGYLYASVNLEEGDKSSDRRVVFNVCEGPLVRIRSIRFAGNNDLATSARLRTQIKSGMAIFGRIGGLYNPAMVEHDVHKIREYYRSNGYLDVDVARRIHPSADLRTVDVVFHVHEGVRYRVGQVNVSGVQNLPQAQVENVLKTKQQQFFNGNDSKSDIKRIEYLHGYRGYKVNVRPDLFFPEPGIVHVKYQVLDQARAPARVGEIHIFGNTKTKDRVIRRVLGIYPGQPLQYPEIRRAEAMLARLNLFEINPELGIRPTIHVVEDPLNPNNPVKDLHVHVRETTTGSLMFGAGVNSNAGLVGSIVLNERNFDIWRYPTSFEDLLELRAFRGGGQELRVEAAPGTELQRYSISFREPFLFDRPYSLTLGAYYYDRIYREYDERRVGGRASIGHQISDTWSVSGGFRIENVRVADVPVFAPIDYQAVVGDNFLFAPRVAIRRDTRDNFLRPTEGNSLELSYEQVLGDFTYPVINLEGNQYFTVFERRDGSGKHVVAVRGQVSWAGDNVPVYDRFFAGGYRSLRGFEFRGVGPFKGGFNVGGNFMVLASAEYQLPILANDKVYLVGFVDSGTVESDVEITNYRVTAGVGARIVVPMMGPVPIAIDFGFPIVKGPFDEEQVFSFYVGISR